MSLFDLNSAILSEASTFSAEEDNVKSEDVEERYVSELYDKFLREIEDYKEELLSFKESQLTNQPSRQIDGHVIDDVLDLITLIEEPGTQSRQEKVLSVQKSSFWETIDEFITQLERLTDEADRVNIDTQHDEDEGEE